jgi:maleate isomerase
MPDVTGFRAKMGVIVPSTNTVVEADFNEMRIPGVTFHAGRMYIERPALDSNETFEDLLGQLRGSIATAIRDVMTCRPDYMVMGMSAETFWGGLEGNQRFTDRVRTLSGGLRVSTGADACRAALEVHQARRISVLTPYQPIMREQIAAYFEDCGFRVVKYQDLKCASATAIADVRPEELRPVLRDLDGPGVDAIVQCGTNLSMVGLAAEAEGWLGKPVIAINTATLWHAYRGNGFPDRLYGFGSLLRDH